MVVFFILWFQFLSLSLQLSEEERARLQEEQNKKMEQQAMMRQQKAAYFAQQQTHHHHQQQQQNNSQQVCVGGQTSLLAALVQVSLCNKLIWLADTSFGCYLCTKFYFSTMKSFKPGFNTNKI